MLEYSSWRAWELYSDGILTSWFWKYFRGKKSGQKLLFLKNKCPTKKFCKIWPSIRFPVTASDTKVRHYNYFCILCKCILHLTYYHRFYICAWSEPHTVFYDYLYHLFHFLAYITRFYSTRIFDTCDLCFLFINFLKPQNVGMCCEYKTGKWSPLCRLLTFKIVSEYNCTCVHLHYLISQLLLCNRFLLHYYSHCKLWKW